MLNRSNRIWAHLIVYHAKRAAAAYDIDAFLRSKELQSRDSLRALLYLIEEQERPAFNDLCPRHIQAYAGKYCGSIDIPWKDILKTRILKEVQLNKWFVIAPAELPDYERLAYLPGSLNDKAFICTASSPFI